MKKDIDLQNCKRMFSIFLGMPNYSQRGEKRETPKRGEKFKKKKVHP